MKSARLAMMAMALVVASATVGRAQDPQPQGGRGGRGMMGQMLFKDITLTPAQTTQRDSIVAKYRAQMQAMRQEMQGGGDREAMMQKNRELMTKQRDELRGILTDDQKKVFDKNVADLEQQMQQRMQNRPPQGGPPAL